MTGINLNIKSWVILPGDRSSFLSARLQEADRTEVVFKSDQRVEPGEKIVACPAIPDKEIHQLDYDDVLQHPERIEGRVTRTQAGFIVINLTKISDNSNTFNQTCDFVVSDFGLQVECSASGEPTLQKLSSWVSQIQQKASMSLRLIIDFSDIQKLPQTGCSVLHDAFQKLKNRDRQIAIIGLDNLCPACKSLDTPTSTAGFIKFFPSKEEADSFFSERPITALVVEDDSVTSMRITHFLQKYSITSIVSETAEDAMDQLSKKTPALILMDIHLPGMSGIEASHKIRLENHLESIPLFMLTTDASQEAVKECMKANVNGYILKPLKEKPFQEKIIQTMLKHADNLII